MLVNDSLPNAHIIRQLFASVQSFPEQWEEACNNIPIELDEYSTSWYVAWNEAWTTALKSPHIDNLRILLEQDNSESTVLYDAVLALVVYPDCAYLLSSTPEQVQIWAALGVDGAILLLPAVKAMAMA